MTSSSNSLGSAVDSATSEDATPFATADRCGRAARRAMRRWVYAASAERLGHLGLIRRSDRSRAFARRHIIIAALGGALFQFSQTGWHVVVRSVDNAMLISTTPSGKAWKAVAVSDFSPVTLGTLAVWWNAVTGGLAFAVAMVSGVLLGYVLTGVMRLGARVALSPAGLSDGRLSGAIDYCTAWAYPLLVAGMITLLRPVRDALVVLKQSWVPSATAITVPAAVVAGVGVLMWWFCLLRVAMGQPVHVRARLAVVFGVVVPVVAAAMVVGWNFGFSRLFEFLPSLLKLDWRPA
jgi:hypothetical protein